MSTALAFDKANRNVTALLWRLLKDGHVDLENGSVFTTAQFVKEWSQGGKKFLEQYWRDSANTPTKTETVPDSELGDGDDDGDQARELFQGKHEWIPTNMLGHIVEYGILKYQEVKWIYLAETLRTPTRLVVVKPTKVRRPHATKNPLGVVGHVGAVYTRDTVGGVNPLFGGQATFHNELREVLKRHLSATANDVAGYQAALAAHITDWYWQGADADLAAVGLPRTAACPYVFNSGVSQYTTWGATLGDMAATLRAEWPNQLKLLHNLFASAEALRQQQKSVAVHGPLMTGSV